MLTYAVFDKCPEAVMYVPLNAGQADVWLRRDIRECAAAEAPDGGTVSLTRYAATEAYMRTSVDLAAIEADFDGWFERASAWRPCDGKPQKPTDAERIAMLEADNAALCAQLTDTQLALCELYEMIGG